MLFITTVENQTPRIQCWSIGKPVPEIKGEIVSFQADGHELAIMKDALHLFNNQTLIKEGQK